MNNAVEKSGGDFGIGKDGVPAGELEVRSDDERLALVALGDNLEKEFGPVRVDRHVAPLVADEQVKLLELGRIKRESSPRRLASVSALTSAGVRQKRVLKPSQQAAIPVAMAR